jgi:hypothetical protein
MDSICLIESPYNFTVDEAFPEFSSVQLDDCDSLWSSLVCTKCNWGWIN